MVQVGPKIKSTQNLLKFGTSDISKISTSILMLKIIFTKYFPPVSTKLVPKFKSAQNSLKFGTFNTSNIPISILISKVVFMKYLPPAMPNWSQNLKCSGFIEIWAHLIFRISRSRFWCQKLFFIKYFPIAWPKLVQK